MLRWVKRVAASVVVLLTLVVISGVGYEQWARRNALREFPPPGQLIEYDGKLSHLNCSGEGSPTVILEAGLGVAGSLNWTSIQPEVASWTQVCSYDRAGILWSEPREEPRDATRIAQELHGLLGAASVSPPYVMVGHSLGGLLVRVYTERFPNEVVGLVFIDSAHPEQFERYPPEVLDYIEETEGSLPPPLLARLWSISGGYRLISLQSPQNAVSAFLPRTVPWGFLGERAARDAISTQSRQTGPFGDLSLVVLTAGVPPEYPGLSDDVMGRFYETWLSLQTELVALSSDSEHRIVEGASHNMHREDPDAVIAAVAEVVEAVRKDASVSDEESDS